MMNRVQKLKINIMTTIIYQLVNVACGFVMPYFILKYYGSQVNGVVYSITQFLAFITLCDCGVGAVVQSALYKPIALRDMNEISRVYKSSARFFNVIAFLFIIYTLLLAIFYGNTIETGFSNVYNASLIVVISFSLLSQYYISMTFRLILNAAQLIYIQMIINSACLIISTAISILLMISGSDILSVKLYSSIVFILQPVLFRYFVTREYSINQNVQLDCEPIKQKWNGLTQHIATVVLENSDVVVLTLLSTLSNVSIYSVYHLVTNGLKMVFINITSSMKSLLGDMYARGENEKLKKVFITYEWLVHNIVTCIFSIAIVLIIPFVRIYTANINDENYCLPYFGLAMCLSAAIYCIRLPYNQMIFSAGHFKETQNSAIYETIMKILLSVFLVYYYGLIGVAISTILALFVRTVYFARYLSLKILKLPFNIFLKRLVQDGAILVFIIVLAHRIVLEHNTYFSWIVMAIEVSAISIITVAAFNLLFNRDLVNSVIKKIISSHSFRSDQR